MFFFIYLLFLFNLEDFPNYWIWIAFRIKRKDLIIKFKTIKFLLKIKISYYILIG
jgi:hypothetical protein